MGVFKDKISIPKLKFYKSLEDLPIYNWHNLPEKGDYNLLLSNLEEIEKHNETAKDKFKVQLHWEGNHENFHAVYIELMQDYIDRYGVNQDTEMLFSFLQKKTALQCDLILTGKKSLKNQIKLVEVEILQLMPDETIKGATLNDSMAVLTKFMGVKLEAKTTSVVDYKSYCDLLDNNNKKTNNGG